jgi:chaperonin cofactor prefoldin
MTETQIGLGKLYFQLKSEKSMYERQKEQLQARINTLDQVISEIDCVLDEELTHVFEHFEENTEEVE